MSRVVKNVRPVIVEGLPKNGKVGWGVMDCGKHKGIVKYFNEGVLPEDVKIGDTVYFFGASNYVKLPEGVKLEEVTFTHDFKKRMLEFSK